MIAQLTKEYFFAKPSKAFVRLLSYFLFEGRPLTTKGIWFNPLTFFSLRSAAKCQSVPSADAPVFITGTGRSGSTMLGMVLSMHPDVGFLNEPKALWYYANPKDDLIGSYSQGEADYIMKAPHASPLIRQTVKSIYSSFLKKSRSNRIVDKYPEMIFRFEFINALFSDAKFIFLYRNPWETIASTALWSEKHTDSDKKESWWGLDNRKWRLLLEQVIPNDATLAIHKTLISTLTSQADKAAVEWIVTMNFGLKMFAEFPEKLLPVKYENLCHQPTKTLHEICVFTGLKEDEFLLKFGKQIITTAPVKSEPLVHPLLHDIILELAPKLGYPVQSVSMSVTE